MQLDRVEPSYDGRRVGIRRTGAHGIGGVRISSRVAASVAACIAGAIFAVGCGGEDEPQTATDVAPCTPNSVYYCAGDGLTESSGRTIRWQACPDGGIPTALCSPSGEVDIITSYTDEEAEVSCADATCPVSGGSCVGLDDFTTCGPADDLLLCDRGTWRSHGSCPGNGACRGSTENWTCGSTTSDFTIDYAVAGRACRAEQGAACSIGQTEVLVCQRGIWEVSASCGEGVSRCDRIRAGQGTCTGPNDCIGCVQ